MEGIVMKKVDSPYLIGKKNDLWLKIKNYRDLNAAIGGFTLKDGIINAILLGLYNDEGELWYIGHTGTGKLSHQDWSELTAKLKPTQIKERPFINKPARNSDAYWVQPTLVAKIRYAEWTEGHSLRQPSIQGFVDIPVYQCRFNQKMVRSG
jgi:bifunctional non-homologous end joining protein LigD